MTMCVRAVLAAFGLFALGGSALAQSVAPKTPGSGARYSGVTVWCAC